LPNESIPLSFKGRIASQIPIPGRVKNFDTGIDFYDLEDEQRKLLKRFIVSLLRKPEA